MVSHFQIVVLVGCCTPESETTGLAVDDRTQKNPNANSHLPEKNWAVLQESLAQDHLIACHCFDPSQASEQSFSEYISQHLPDLICFFPDTFDTSAQQDAIQPQSGQRPEKTSSADLLAFLKAIDRCFSGRQKPSVVVYSDCEEAQRIDYIIHGADDTIQGSVSFEELRVRLLAHMRRNLDAQRHEVTCLPNLKLAQKVVQRRLNYREKQAMMLIGINGLAVYTENYGSLATWQVLKTLTNILVHVIIPPDCIFQSDGNDFLILSSPDKTEKVARLVCKQFDLAVPNFYAEPERKRGFMVSVLHNQTSRRVPLLSASIGIASAAYQKIESFVSGYTTAQQMRSVAQTMPFSSWHINRPQLSSMTPEKAVNGTVSIEQPLPEILIAEPDETLAYLLQITLAMEGYTVVVAGTMPEATHLLETGFPKNKAAAGLVVLDALLPDASISSRMATAAGVSLHTEKTESEQAAQRHRFISGIRRQNPSLQLVCTSSLGNQAEVIEAGVDLYLPKPYELSVLFYWIKQLAG
ncbi:MAG: diguanylate cyclase [Cyanobacteria bacterium P01_H01_bin.74]